MSQNKLLIFLKTASTSKSDTLNRKHENIEDKSAKQDVKHQSEID